MVRLDREKGRGGKEGRGIEAEVSRYVEWDRGRESVICAYVFAYIPRYVHRCVRIDRHVHTKCPR